MKKIEKLIKLEKIEKQNLKKPNHEKNPIKPIRIFKKPTSSVWFRFYKLKTEKTKPNQKKMSQIKKNQFLF